MSRFKVNQFSASYRFGLPLLCILVASALVVSSSAQTSIFNIQKSPNRNSKGNTLNAVAAVSPSDAWAVGFQNDNFVNDSRTLTLHWDGVSWQNIPSPNPGSPSSCDGFNTGNELTSVAELSDNNVWAVGFSFDCVTEVLKPMVVHWEGQRWKVVSTPPLGNNNAALGGIIALATDNIYAVGYQPATNGAVLTLIEHWDGKSWTVVPSPNRSATQNQLSAVSANSPTDMWAVGVSGDEATSSIQTLVEHFDGKRWRVVPSPNPLPMNPLNQNILTSVHAVSANNVTAVGLLRDADHRRVLTLIEHWNGKKWSVVPSANQNEAAGSLNVLTGLTALSAGDLYSVGFFSDSSTNGQDETLVEHFDGKHWSIIPSPIKGLAQQLNGVFSLPASTDVWTVGAFSNEGVQFETGFLQVPRTLVLFSGNAN